LNADDFGILSLQKRTKRLARALGMTPTRKTHAIVEHGKWWLVGCKEGDRLLPRADRYSTLREALDSAEAWLAPELSALRDDSDQ